MSVKLLTKLKAVKVAAQELRSRSDFEKNQVLLTFADLLLEENKGLLRANLEDLRALGMSATLAFRDRLLLDGARIEQMVKSLRAVALLPDPVGEVSEEKILSNGLKLKRVRSPLGVIFMIFESRPNVAVEAFSLAFKAGNVIILRGGRETMRTTSFIYSLLARALKTHGFNRDSVWGIKDSDRKIPFFLLKQNSFIDVVVPRGGAGLINFVVKNSKIPIIKNDRGLCHVYIHEDAKFEMALKIAYNSKTHRPGVCNSMETLLVHKRLAKQFIPALYEAMAPLEVEWRACPKTFSILKKQKNVKRAGNKDWDTEYLDLIMNCRVVDSEMEAIEHIEKHGSLHSESIVTESENCARNFQNSIDSAAVYWNASTRFTDGFEFGLGGELGISTQKLHVRGPIGLRELTSLRWVIDGSGQVRS